MGKQRKMQKVEKKRNRIPTNLREQIIAELGTLDDSAIAAKYSEKAGFEIDRHAIFFLRRSRGIPAVRGRGYTYPGFRGRIEDTYPEIADLLGKVPLIHIANRYGVSRSCIRAAAQRLKKPTRATDFKEVFEAVGAK